MDGVVVALVGHGKWGRHVLRDLVALNCRVTVVSRGLRARDAVLEAGAAGVVATVGELPEETLGVVVVTPTTTHAAVVEPILASGLPVFVEKPLADDAEDATRLAESAPDRLFVMHKWRYHPGIELLAEIARSGELGPVVGLRTTRVGWGNPHGDLDAIWMLAPHDISIALEVLGEIPEPRAATAEYVSGTATGMTAVLGDDPWFAFDVSTAHPIRRREVRLICRGGVAVLADAYSDVVLVARGELHETVRLDEERRPISTELPLLRELRAFVEHLEGGPPPRSSAAEGAAEVATISRLRELAGLAAASVVP